MLESLDKERENCSISRPEYIAVYTFVCYSTYIVLATNTQPLPVNFFFSHLCQRGYIRVNFLIIPDDRDLTPSSFPVFLFDLWLFHRFP